MVWSIKEVSIAADDSFIVEVENVSGGTLNAANYSITASSSVVPDTFSTNNTSFGSNDAFNGGTAFNVADGDVFTFGIGTVNGQVPDFDVSGFDLFTTTAFLLPTPNLSGLDGLGIREIGGNVITHIGDADSSVALGSGPANYQLPVGDIIDGVENDTWAGFAGEGFVTGTLTDGTLGVANTLCFGTGTLIATPDGAQRVENLAIGDMILTSDNRTVPVKWLAKQTVRNMFDGAERLRPVRITAGALGDGLPLRDLVVTADHAMVVDGLLANASALVNSTTIRWEPIAHLGPVSTYWHIETEGHQIILAEGAATETFVDYVSRQAFDNYDEFLKFYGEPSHEIVEMDLPRVSSRRLLPRHLRSKLDAVATQLLENTSAA